jgi:hypothetical protein
MAHGECASSHFYYGFQGFEGTLSELVGLVFEVHDHVASLEVDAGLRWAATKTQEDEDSCDSQSFHTHFNSNS